MSLDESVSSDEERILRRIANGGGRISVLGEEIVTRLFSRELIYRDGAVVRLTELGRQRVYSAGGL